MIGSTYQINEARPYTESGQRGLHVQTLLATVVGVEGDHVFYSAEVVAEDGRPNFARNDSPIGGEILESALARRVHTGEWQTVTTPEAV